MNADSEAIADENNVKDMIEKFWGDIVCLDGNATCGVKKELVDSGMNNEVGSIHDQDLKTAIKLMKGNTATDE